MGLEASIPRFPDYAGLRNDPLWFLRTVRQSTGRIAVISEDGGLFSRTAQCTGAVAAFGPEAVQEVLTTTETFGMPMSVGDRFGLPLKLKRLTSGLFSMQGERHRIHQQLLLSVVGHNGSLSYSQAIRQGWNKFKEDIFADRDVRLHSEMRRLALNIATRIIFGSAEMEIGKRIQSYFDDRRNFAKEQHDSDSQDSRAREGRRTLVRTGLELDGMLRASLEELRRNPSRNDGASGCVLGRLAELESGPRTEITDDDRVAHANVLFMSSSEPVAVALTWTLLLLSQYPEILARAQQEVASVFADCEPPTVFSERDLPVLRNVVLESLRVLPPNALMVRLTSRVGELLGYRLPECCEVVLSPYVEHRDAVAFEEPDRFLPSRWRGLNPSPYSYFPFGAGSRFCLGKQLASFILVSIVARIIQNYDIHLACDQVLDWKMDITLMPVGDVVVRFVSRTSRRPALATGRLGGPVADLILGRPSGHAV
jgi:cytochrome P450